VAGENILVIDDSPTLLRIVARTLGRAGYKVRTAEGGAKGIGLAKVERPDIILLDYLMPGLNGDQVCRMLGQDPALRDVPVVVMSARAEKMAQHFEELGAVDYISKPFSPDALVAVTTHAIDKFVREGTPPPRLAQTPEPGTGPELLVHEVAERPQQLVAVRAKLAERLGPALEDALNGIGPDSDARARRAALEHAIGTALSESALSELTGELSRAFPEQNLGTDAVLIGDIDGIPVADVLQMMAVQKQHGTFLISRGDLRVEVYLRDGRVDFVGGRNLREEFLIGRFIVDVGAISRQDLDLFLQSRAGSRKLLGAQLIKLGYITEDDLRVALRQQSSEIIYDVLRWQNGRFTLRRGKERPPYVEAASLDLAVEQLLMEGFRRVDEWSMIEKVIHSFEIVFQRDDDAIRAFGFDSLQPEELVILDLVDAVNNVRDLVTKSKMGSFEVCKLVYRLISSRLIRKRVEPAPPDLHQNVPRVS
jgi:CheY-like chemotaxis protein